MTPSTFILSVFSFIFFTRSRNFYLTIRRNLSYAAGYLYLPLYSIPRLFHKCNRHCHNYVCHVVMWQINYHFGDNQNSGA